MTIFKEMIKVKFLRNIIKAGIVRKPGDTMELPETTAALLAEKGVIEVEGKKAVRKKVEVDVVTFEDVVAPKKAPDLSEK